MQPERSEEIRHSSLHLFAGELTFHTVNEAVSVGDLSENHDGVKDQDQEAYPRRTPKKPCDGSGLKESVPEG